jgi:hypothetical protein
MSQKKLPVVGGEVVRLLVALRSEGLSAGDCGVLWGIYPTEPILYEADFISREGECLAAMFEAEDVEVLENAHGLLQEPRLLAIQKALRQGKESEQPL